MINFTDNVNLLNAVTATVANTSASQYDVSKRGLKSIQFTCSGHTSGNGAFGVEVSDDGVNWIVYNRLIPNLNGTNSQTDAYVSAPTLSSNTSAIYFFPVSDYFRMIRVFVTVTTDGVYTATLQAAG
jgi:hypothetical protein